MKKNEIEYKLASIENYINAQISNFKKDMKEKWDKANSETIPGALSNGEYLGLKQGLIALEDIKQIIEN